MTRTELRSKLQALDEVCNYLTELLHYPKKQYFDDDSLNDIQLDAFEDAATWAADNGNREEANWWDKQVYWMDEDLVELKCREFKVPSMNVAELVKNLVIEAFAWLCRYAGERACPARDYHHIGELYSKFKRLKRKAADYADPDCIFPS